MDSSIFWTQASRIESDRRQYSVLEIERRLTNDSIEFLTVIQDEGINLSVGGLIDNALVLWHGSAMYHLQH